MLQHPAVVFSVCTANFPSRGARNIGVNSASSPTKTTESTQETFDCLVLEKKTFNVII